MSDIFDHMLDALECEEMEQDDNDGINPAFERHIKKRYAVAAAPVANCVQTQPSRPARCKRCGCSGLHWVHDRGQYRLFGSDGLPHVCEVTKNGTSRNDLYRLVDGLDSGELNELKHYCEQRLADKKEKHSHGKS